MNTEDKSAGSAQSQDIEKVLSLREALITGKPPRDSCSVPAMRECSRDVLTGAVM